MRSKYLLAVLTFSFLLGSTITMAAQDEQKSDKIGKHPTAEQMEQIKCKRMVKELMLDDATSAKFIPLYKQYLKELKACKPHDKDMKNAEKKGTLTNATAEKLIKEQFTQTRKKVDIQEKYYGEFHKFLTPQQILKLYRHKDKKMDKRNMMGSPRKMIMRSQQLHQNQKAG